jgi:hypothetical protein
MTAAVTDPYAAAADYLTRCDKTDTGDNTEITAQLTAVSRVIDKACGRFFTVDAAAVARTYDGNGSSLLWLPDDISSTTALVVKADLNADYDYADSNETLTINTHFWVGPQNADKGAEVWPWEFLEIVPGNSVISAWPKQRRSVQVTATFGWPAIPAAIKEATIAITRQLRDMQEAGFTLTLENIDAAINISPVAAGILKEIKQAYARKVMSFG